MSREFDMIEQQKVCSKCIDCYYYNTCRLLQFLNGTALKNAIQKYDERFGCSFFEPAEEQESFAQNEDFNIQESTVQQAPQQTGTQQQFRKTSVINRFGK